MAGFAGATVNNLAISTSASADLVNAVTGKIIRVTSLFIVCDSAVTVKFQSGASTDLTGALSFAANGGIALTFNEKGWFQTASGAKLNVVLGGSVGVRGALTYTVV